MFRKGITYKVLTNKTFRNPVALGNDEWLCVYVLLRSGPEGFKRSISCYYHDYYYYISLTNEPSSCVSAGPFTFEVILHHDGTIIFVYDEVKFLVLACLTF